MVGSGTLDTLLAKGFKYMFVSNSDNLGATMDLKLLTWFAQSKVANDASMPLIWQASCVPIHSR